MKTGWPKTIRTKSVMKEAGFRLPEAVQAVAELSIQAGAGLPREALAAQAGHNLLVRA
jgi:hypothetical protein